MRKRTWLPAKPKRQHKPKVSDEVRRAVDAQLAPVIAKLKQQVRKKSTNPLFNWPADVFARWHRDAVYFVVVMRTPRGPTFESHAVRMDYAGRGRFDLAVPMRRGWNTIKRDARPEECLREVEDLVWF